ncbi:Norsolorinic acid reductase [Echria macrotheca]|uniref:Norsolorinic acid reductase n=1 Tax=Echria macrotheca TaxID=438768 RepID=A0AAJ0B5R2_9PEZI|nr:Norsolorinic acid reductase [Echria macrotheca]
MPVNPLPYAPPPPGPLGHYRLLSPTASVRVSPLCLGAMNFGEAWKDYMGECSEETTNQILDFFYEQGGNFIDTSNNYQFEESETRIGAWMKRRGNRDQMVIATKYTTNYQAVDLAAGMTAKASILANFGGNGSKSLHASVAASLKKLQTDYIDLLYVHWWDHSASIPELMQSLNHLVAAGKVLYLGISDAPAWVVSKANEYARAHGLRQFCVYQGLWSASTRDLEREVIPMCRAEGMAIAPWGSLGGGKFKTDEQRAQKGGRAAQATEKDVLVSKALESVATRKGTLITSVALAYVRAKAPYVFPIVGGRTVEHLKGNIEALTLKLSDEDIKEIEGAAPFDVGFPYNFMYGPSMPDIPGQVSLLGLNGTLEHVPEPKPAARE